KKEREGKAVQRHPGEHPAFAVQGTESVPEQSKSQPGTQRPLEPPAPQRARKRDHGDDFGHLSQRHPGCGALDSQLPQMSWSEWVKRRERNGEQRRSYKDHAMVALFEE